MVSHRRKERGFMNIARRMMAGWSAAGVLNLVCLVSSAPARPTADQVLTEAGLSTGDRQSVMAGEFVNVDSKGVSERDLAFAIAFFVKTPPETLAKQIVAGELVTADQQVKVYGELSGNWSVADFAKLTLPADQGKGLANAQAAGNINIKTDHEAA